MVWWPMHTHTNSRTPPVYVAVCCCAGVEFEIAQAPAIDLRALAADTAADLRSRVAAPLECDHGLDLVPGLT